MGGFFCCFQKNPFGNNRDPVPSDAAGTSAGTSKTNGVETTKKQAKLDRKKAKKEAKARKKASKLNKKSKKFKKTTSEEDGNKDGRNETLQLVEKNEPPKTKKTDGQMKKDTSEITIDVPPVKEKIVEAVVSTSDANEVSKANSKDVVQTIVVVADVHPVPEKFLELEAEKFESIPNKEESKNVVQNKAIGDVDAKIAETEKVVSARSAQDLSKVAKAEDKEVAQSEDTLEGQGEKEPEGPISLAIKTADAINEINDVTNEADCDVVASPQLEVSNKAAIAMKPSAISLNFEVGSVESSDVPNAECEPNEPDREPVSDTSCTEDTITSSTNDDAGDVSAREGEACDQEIHQHEPREDSDGESDDSSIDLVACLVPHPSEAVQVAFVARVPADKDDALAKEDNNSSATEQSDAGKEKDAFVTEQ